MVGHQLLPATHGDTGVTRGSALWQGRVKLDSEGSWSGPYGFVSYVFRAFISSVIEEILREDSKPQILAPLESSAGVQETKDIGLRQRRPHLNTAGFVIIELDVTGLVIPPIAMLHGRRERVCRGEREAIARRVT